MKGVSKEQAEEIAKQLEEHPEIAESLKALEQNKEVKTLMEKIQKEIEEKTGKKVVSGISAKKLLAEKNKKLKGE